MSPARCSICPKFSRCSVTEHRAHDCGCAACGTRTRAAFPEGVTAPAQYDKRIGAFVVTGLRLVRALPGSRCQLFRGTSDSSSWSTGKSPIWQPWCRMPPRGRRRGGVPGSPSAVVPGAHETSVRDQLDKVGVTMSLPTGTNGGAGVELTRHRPGARPIALCLPAGLGRHSGSDNVLSCSQAACPSNCGWSCGLDAGQAQRVDPDRLGHPAGDPADGHRRVSADLLRGPHYTLGETVTTLAYLNRYIVTSDYGPLIAPRTPGYAGCCARLPPWGNYRQCSRPTLSRKRQSKPENRRSAVRGTCSTIRSARCPRSPKG